MVVCQTAQPVATDKIPMKQAVLFDERWCRRVVRALRTRVQEVAGSNPSSGFEPFTLPLFFNLKRWTQWPVLWLIFFSLYRAPEAWAGWTSHGSRKMLLWQKQMPMEIPPIGSDGNWPGGEVARLGRRWLSYANRGSRSERPTVGGDCSETGSRSRRENSYNYGAVLRKDISSLSMGLFRTS